MTIASIRRFRSHSKPNSHCCCIAETGKGCLSPKSHIKEPNAFFTRGATRSTLLERTREIGNLFAVPRPHLDYIAQVEIGTQLGKGIFGDLVGIENHPEIQAFVSALQILLHFLQLIQIERRHLVGLPVLPAHEEIVHDNAGCLRILESEIQHCIAPLDSCRFFAGIDNRPGDLFQRLKRKRKLLQSISGGFAVVADNENIRNNR